MAQALVVAKAKIENDLQDQQIRDHRRPMHTRQAQQLHEDADVPLGLCGIDEAKQFQAYLSDYQINNYRKNIGKKLFTAAPKKTRRLIYTCTTIITM